MDTVLDRESKPNGAMNHHHHLRHPPPAEAVYRECMKNHAASLGGHALDGCGEFMPSRDPSSFLCAACSCHRNFHRRLPSSSRQHHEAAPDGHDSDDGIDNGEEEEEEEQHRLRRRRRRSRPLPPPYFSSAPHMLLSLRAGISGRGSSGTNSGGPVTQVPATTAPAVAMVPRKRFRTKFSSEQKERMVELAERVGWRVSKGDEELVEENCKEIGVGRGVFKIWMHNNKHSILGPKRREMGSNSGGGEREEGNGGDFGETRSNNNMMNSSSSPSS